MLEKGVVNDPNKNNNVYNERHSYPGVSVFGTLRIENSTLDTTGINLGIVLDKVPVLKGNVSVTDANGTALNLAKIHSPITWMNGDMISSNYAYSTSTDEDVYYFDTLPNRVIIKALKKQISQQVIVHQMAGRLTLERAKNVGQSTMPIM